MMNWLLRHLVRDYEQTHDPRVRARYGVLAGMTGILLNICLFAGKFIAGTLAASIAVTADAFNNLSDAGSSLVTLIGFKMAGMPADKEHPFGHGRIEYLAGLCVSGAILLVGIELGRGALGKIARPESVEFNSLSLGIMCVAVVVKLWMGWFNRTLAKRIDSPAMRATAMDSLTDAVATTAVIIGMLVARATSWRLDGYIGLLVAGFILYTGFNTAKDSLSPLLGKAPDPEMVAAIRALVVSHEPVRSIHDLIVHDYGPGRCMISLHAELPSTMDVLEMHDLIDLIEQKLREQFHCDVTIHMDPVAVNDPDCDRLRDLVEALVHGIDGGLSIHDFRMVRGVTHTNLIFDLQVPYQVRIAESALEGQVRAAVHGLSDEQEQYFGVVKVERAMS